MDGAWDTLKIHLPLVLGRAILIRRRVVLKDLVEICRMCLFLGSNAGLFHLLLCGIVRLCGGYHILTAAMPAFATSVVAFKAAPKSSRVALSLYCATVACDVAYIAAKFRGWVRPVPKGEVLIFSLAAAGLMLVYEDVRKEAESQGMPTKTKKRCHLTCSSISSVG